MLEVKDLTKRFGDAVALDAVGFCVSHGEIVGLVGPNGAGKTTLLETLCGLQHADRGRVLWHSTPLPPDRRKDAMFYVPDGIAPYSPHSVGAVLGFFSQVYGRPPDALESAIKSLALESVISKTVETLSKGYRRRLLVALGLITPHPLLLMDEPFDGFDLRQTREVMQILRCVAEKGRSLLLSIHQLADAERLCDRFVLLSGGRVRGEGSLAELKAKTGTQGRGLEDAFLALT
jgi:ABC-2 type transport system ATP-binding protein